MMGGMGTSASTYYPDPLKIPTCPICGKQVEEMVTEIDTYEVDPDHFRMWMTNRLITLYPCKDNVTQEQALEMTREAAGV